MRPRSLFHTAAAILICGLVSVAASQPDQKAPDAGSAKNPDKTTQPRQQRQKPQAQAQGQQQRQQRQQPQAQARQQRQQPQAQAQARPQRTPGQGRQPQAAPTMAHRPMQGQNQAQRGMGQRTRSQVSTQTPRQQTVATGRNRLTPSPRQVTQTPVAQRPSGSRVEQQTVWPRYRATSWNTQHRSWVQRGGYSGYRIPTASFSLYFGRPHRFHLSSYRIRVVGEYPEFYADGFWFTMLDPVPEYWDNDWYDTDYCTVVQSDDGYYLVNDAYPQAQISISVAL